MSPKGSLGKNGPEDLPARIGLYRWNAKWDGGGESPLCAIMHEPFTGYANAKRALEAGGDLPHETALDLLGKAIGEIERLQSQVRELRRDIRETETQRTYTEQEYYDLQGSEP